MLHGATGAFLIKGFAAILVFLMNLLLAKLLSTGDYGVVSLGLSWLNIASIIALMGSDTVSVRFIAQARAIGDAKTVTEVLKWGYKITLRLGSMLALVSIMIIWFLFPELQERQRIALCIVVLSTPSLAFALNRVGVLRGAKRAIVASVIEVLIRPTVVILTIISAVYIWGYIPTTIDVAVIVVVGNILMMIIGILLTRQLSRKRSQICSQNSRKWIDAAKPIAIMNVMGALIANIDTLIIGFFVDVDSAGIYRASAQLALFVSFGLAATNGVVAPLIAEFYSQKKREDLRRILNFSVIIVSMVGVGGALFLGVSGKMILGFFGDEYKSGYSALVILLLSHAVNALCGPTGYIMSMTGHQLEAVRIFVAGAVISVASNLLLIPLYDILGAAIANLLASVFWNLYILYFLITRLNINPSIFAAFNSAGARFRSRG